MSATLYRPGTAIILKPRSLGRDQVETKAIVVASQPETRGAIRYRIRLEGERFERTIGEDDIDELASPTRDVVSAVSLGGKSSWINHAAVRTRK